MQEEEVQDVVNINKMKFKLYRDLVDHPLLDFNENLINKTRISELKMMKHQRQIISIIMT